MGRLIDADILIAELKESALHHCNNPREDTLLQRDRVIVRAQPTVEAIPKDQLTELRSLALRVKHNTGSIDTLIDKLDDLLKEVQE